MIEIHLCHHPMQLAAQRITNYWNRRIEIFGKNRAFKPLHLGEDGVLSSTTPGNDCDETSDDDTFIKHTLQGLSLGFIRSMQRHDSGGRAILFADPSRLAGYDKNNNDERMGVARAMWLIFHQVIVADEMVQKLGNTVLIDFSSAVNEWQVSLSALSHVNTFLCIQGW